MIPLRDLTRPRSTPVVTYGLLGANVVMFFYQIISPTDGLQLACIPNALFHPLRDGWLWAWATLITSAFLHGGWLHIIFNMLFLWIFGDNVEDRLGHIAFLVFYLAGAAIAGLTHSVFSLGSTVPMVGASGAISAVLGAYAVFYPWSKIRTLFLIIVFPVLINVPALIFIGIWFAGQIASSLVNDPTAPGVAWWAHIGGFVFGFLWALKIWDRRKR